MVNIDSGKVLYSGGNNDECYTPDYAVKPILEYIPKDAIVWCPFDTKDSEFVKLISQTNPVEYSHLNKGQDFFQYEPDEWHMMVSNPPFSRKKKFFERALSFNKPFALIMTNTWLNDSAPKQLFKDRDLQLLMFDKRIEFTDPTGQVDNKITFSSSYYCWNFLKDKEGNPKQIIMKKLDKPKHQPPPPKSITDKYDTPVTRACG